MTAMSGKPCEGIEFSHHRLLMGGSIHFEVVSILNINLQQVECPLNRRRIYGRKQLQLQRK
jgi:hypothetical protein